MGEDVGLLSYLSDDKARKMPFDDQVEIKGHPLPIRILFGNLERDTATPREVWALLHSKPGSNRTPEVRMKIFSQQGELEGAITLDEALEQASPAAAFTCIRAQHDHFDRAHLSSVLRYYLILQKVQLSSSWPISDMMISELKGD